MIVEDGTGVPNADSYVSVEDATAFHEARGNAAWATADSTTQAQAIVRATDYIDQYFQPNVSRKATRTQGLQWPRWRERYVHPLIRKATMILALEAMSQTLSERKDRETKMTLKTLTGVGEIRTQLDDTPVIDHYLYVTEMLRPVATRRDCGVSFSRVVPHWPHFDSITMELYDGREGYGSPDGYMQSSWPSGDGF